MTITVEYRFHPLFGHELKVLRAPRIADGAFEVVGPDDVTLKVPRWMTLPESRCLQLSSEATVSMEALLALASLLEAANIPSCTARAMTATEPRRNDEADSARAQRVEASVDSASHYDAKRQGDCLDGRGDQRRLERKSR